MDILTNLINETSFAGCREITLKGRSLLDRVFWAIWVLIGIALSVSFVWLSWTSYQENPTTVLVARDTKKMCHVPAITLCTEIIYTNGIAGVLFKKMWGRLQNEKRRNYYMKLLSLIAHFSYWKLGAFSRYILDPSLPNSHFVELQKKMTRDEFKIVNTFNPWHAERSTPAVYGEGGFCKCFNCLYGESPLVQPKFHRSRDGELLIDCYEVQSWNILLKNKYRYRILVYVHSPYDVPDFTVDPTLQYRTPTEILETFKIHRVMKSVGLHSLGISQRKCVFSYENKLSVSPWYSQSMCLLQCRRDLAVKLCGCSPHVYNVQDETPICSVQDFSCLHANKALLKQNNVSECSCPYDCGFAKIIRLQSKHLSQRTESYGYYLRPELLQEMMFEHNVILSKLDMFASWGGTVSFFLGGSVLSLMEFLYLLVRYLILGLISYQHHKIQNWLRRYKAWCKKKIPKVCLAMNVKLKILKPRLKIATILPIQIPMSVLIRVIKDWLTASTIHGVKNFHNHSFIAIERLVWICLVLTSIVMSHHFAVQLVEERPILMYEETVSQTPLPFQFPAVYVLHALATLNESIEQLYDTETMVTEAEVRRGILYPNLQSFCGPIGCGYDIESLRAGIVPDMIAEQLNCSLNLLTCQINYQKFPCCKIFNSALTAEGPMLVANSMLLGKEEHEYPFYFRRLLSQPHYKVTFDMMFVNQKKKVLTSLFLVLSTDKTDVPFQSQLHYFMGTQEHNTGIGEVTVMETHVDPDVLELEPEDRTCRMPSETLPNSFFRNYGYGGCLLECRARVMLLLCGCVHYYSPVRGDVPRCDMKGIQCLVKNNEKFLSSRAIADCQCLPNCATSFFNLIRNERNYTDADKTTMHITYLPSYKKMQVRLNRGSLETFVGAGGLVSLFLGCSVLSIVEFIFYFTMRFTSQLLQELIGHYCVRRSTTNISPLRNR